MFHKPTVTHHDIEVAHIDWHGDRGPISLSGASDKITIVTPISGGGRLVPPDLKADASGTVNATSTLTVAPDYNIRPVVTVSVNIAKADLHGISVHDIVQGAISDAINKFEAGIGPLIGKLVDLHKVAQTAWSKLPQSFTVPDVKSMWISIIPQAIMLDGPHVSTDSATATLAVKADIRTLYQTDQRVAPPPVALPNISGIPADNKFHIDLPVEIDEQALNQTLADLISTKEISTLKVGKGQTVQLKAISVYPYGNRFYLKIRFVGLDGAWVRHVKGTVIFVAHPLLSADKKSLSFDKIDYTPETMSTLKGLGLEAIAVLGKPIITPILQKILVINFDPFVQKAKLKASALPAKLKLAPPLSLDLTLTDLSPEEVAVYGNKIFLDIDAAGTAKPKY